LDPPGFPAASGRPSGSLQLPEIPINTPRSNFAQL
jgi:hypothetical protein